MGSTSLKDKNKMSGIKVFLLHCSITKLMKLLNMYVTNVEPKSLFSISRKEKHAVLLWFVLHVLIIQIKVSLFVILIICESVN